jgi:excinuclease ABC subunit C
MQILAHARDEAHRASNALRVKLGKKRKLESSLDSIEGVGRKTRATLLKAFGSQRAIEAGEVEQLVTAGATRKQAEAIYARYHPRPSEGAETEALEELAVEHAFEP